MAAKIGVDTGVAFTDFIDVDEHGFKIVKVLSTPGSPARRAHWFTPTQLVANRCQYCTRFHRGDQRPARDCNVRRQGMASAAPAPGRWLDRAGLDALA
jgi:hypothetical protein